jgi:hypothetical protein
MTGNSPNTAGEPAAESRVRTDVKTTSFIEKNDPMK